MFGVYRAIFLGGAVVTETVFNLNGVGTYLVRALQSDDRPAAAGVVIFASLFIAVATLVVDLAHGFLDPRVRYNVIGTGAPGGLLTFRIRPRRWPRGEGGRTPERRGAADRIEACRGRPSRRVAGRPRLRRHVRGLGRRPMRPRRFG